MDDRVPKKPRSDHSASYDQGGAVDERVTSTSSRSTESHRSQHSYDSRDRDDRDRSHHRHHESDRDRRHREHRERRRHRDHDDAYRGSDGHRHSHREHRSHSERHHADHGHRRRSHRDDRDDRLSPEPDAPAPTPAPTSSGLKRDDWMILGNPEAGGSHDFFSTMGETKAAEPAASKPDPDALQVHARELNPGLNPHAAAAAPASSEAPADQPASYGAPGHKWRMMKLRRTYEIAEQSGVPLEQVAVERYGSMDAFDEARREHQYLEDTGRSSKDAPPSGTSTPRSGSHVFRRPGVASSAASATSRTSTPEVTSVRIPTALPQAPVPNTEATAAPSLSELNRLEAKALRAEMMNQPDAPALRTELEKARQALEGSAPRETVEVVPVIDGYGRMYDVGTSRTAEAVDPSAQSRKRRKQGMDEPEDASLTELVHEERLGAGRMDQKNVDAALAQQIATDHGFENDLDYIDSEAQRFARKKMRDDAMKRQFAIQDFARTKRALDECTFCWQDEGRMAPRANIVSSGTCTYLALPDREPLVDGHCWIVPMQHHVSSLDVDENGWTEIRNFMKCLIRMAASRNQSMVFFETVLSLRQQKHTYIEAVPVPNDAFAEVPAYFKTALSDVESEWADHAKIIYFSEARPFQRSMVSRLPYFMVQWDYKGQRGYGHVIESRDDEHGIKKAGTDNEEPTYADGDHVGGAGFPKYVPLCTNTGTLRKRF